MINLKLFFLQSELERVIGWIKFSDRKSAFLSVFYAAVFGLVVKHKDSILEDLLIIQYRFVYAYYIIILCTGFFFIVGIYFLFKSIFPRLDNKLTDNSLFYFGNISKMKFVDYQEKMEKLSEGDSKKQILEQIYTNSVIANLKMGNVGNSTVCLMILLFFTMLLILL